MSKKVFSFAQERCIKLAGKLMQATNMIYPNARIGVALSGGMDSWVLLQVLRIRQKIVPFPFEIIVLHVNPGFDPNSHLPLIEWLNKNPVPAHIEVTNHGLAAHSSENRTKSPCFYCAMLRRKRLFQLWKEYNLTHLAFGHNADDLVTTFFMNMFQSGSINGMSAKEGFFKGYLNVIRPLLLVEKKLIAKAVEQWELPVWSNPCPSAGNTKRSEIWGNILDACEGEKGRKKNIFNALCRWQLTKQQEEEIIYDDYFKKDKRIPIEY